MNRTTTLRWAAVLSCSVLLMSGCSALRSESPAIDPPQNVSVDGQLDAEAEQAHVKTTLYFMDKNGFVAPISMKLPDNGGPAKQALAYMTEGGIGEEQIPKGFRALLPKGTTVLAFNIDKDAKKAVVDFSGEFTDYNVQDERAILESLTWTLTGFPSIDQVEIWVDGKALGEMPRGGTPLDEPLSRQMGINVETAADVSLSQSMPVTLYFQSEDSEGGQYYVPVTRLVPRSDNTAEAAVMQLAAGPMEEGLASPVMAESEILGVELQKDTVTVNFSSSMADDSNTLPTETLETVLLSLTETTGAKQVQFMIDGKPQVNSSDERSFTKPVTAPEYVNPAGL